MNLYEITFNDDAYELLEIEAYSCEQRGDLLVVNALHNTPWDML